MEKLTQPLLHVFIPAYGESPYLKQTLESAVKHIPIDIPITVIEDQSDCASLNRLVEEFPRIDYIKNTSHFGISKNFNQAIELSKGLYTQICGSDDLFTKNPLDVFDSMTSFIPEIAAVSLDVEVINNYGKLINTLPDQVKRLIRPKTNNVNVFSNNKLFSRLMIGDWLYFPAILWKTEIIKKFKFSGGFHTAMDLDLFIRLLQNDMNIECAESKILRYRRHDQSASSLYAKSLGRFEEEFKCHKNAIEVARDKNWRLGVILAQVALTVRLHAIMQSFLMVFSSPRSALKVLVKAISPIR